MSGALAPNIAHFARALRAAGVAVGPGAVLDATAAVEAVGFSGRADLYWTLHAALVRRREDMPVFAEVFARFWRRRAFVETMMALMAPPAPAPGRPDASPPPGALRAAQALAAAEAREDGAEEIELSARLTVSGRERLGTKDFAQMTAAELAEAQRALRSLRMPDDRVASRRLVPVRRGARVDLRRTLRAALRSGGEPLRLVRRDASTRPAPLVALLDVSGSMDGYVRPVLHFLHALLASGRRVEVFLFATRLTVVTRTLKARDPDVALAAVGRAVEDWSGGTRIADALRRFNRDWSRRALSGSPTVLLMTDGLERPPEDDAAAADLAFEADRLRRSCRRLVWLNPLLRYDGFEPRAAGIRTLLPRVDEMRPVHNLASVASLVEALSAPAARPLMRAA